MTGPEESRPQLMEGKPDRFIGESDVPGLGDMMRQQFAGPEIDAIPTRTRTFADPAGQRLAMPRLQHGLTAWSTADLAQPAKPLDVVAFAEKRRRTSVPGC